MAPHEWTVPIYGKNRQLPQPIDTSSLLDKQGIKYVQRSTVGSFLYIMPIPLITQSSSVKRDSIKPSKTTSGKNEIALSQAKRQVVDSDTIKCIPHTIPFPETDLNDHVRKTLQDITQLILLQSTPMPSQITPSSRMVCDYQPFKSEKYRVRLTIGEDRFQYPDDAASPAALLETKILLNSTISQSAHGCRFVTLDIKYFFLQTTMNNKEYMRIHNK